MDDPAALAMGERIVHDQEVDVRMLARLTACDGAEEDEALDPRPGMRPTARLSGADGAAGALERKRAGGHHTVPSGQAMHSNEQQTQSPPATTGSGYEFDVLARPGRTLTKYVFIQDDPFYLPKVLDKYLREFASSTAGVNIQPNNQGKRT